MIKRKMEFSKKIFAGISIAVIIVSLFSMYMIYITNDLGPLPILIGAVFTEFATATAFYFWKAKAENIIKLGGKPNDFEH